MSGKQYMEQHSRTSRRIACMCYNGELRGFNLAKLLAVEWAFEQGCRKALLLGAWGGRLDQALGNCTLLMRFPGRLALWDDRILAQAVGAGQEIVLPVTSATVVSLIPFAEGTRVRTTGLKYLLNDEPIKHATHGISNVAMESHPSVAVSKGMILLCVEGGETWLTE